MSHTSAFAYALCTIYFFRKLIQTDCLGSVYALYRVKGILRRCLILKLVILNPDSCFSAMPQVTFKLLETLLLFCT